jgi:hypothetical protein
MSAVATGNQTACIHHVVGTTHFVAQEYLHPIPSLPVDQWFVLPWVPFTMMFDLTNVRAVGQDGIELARAELRS